MATGRDVLEAGRAVVTDIATRPSRHIVDLEVELARVVRRHKHLVHTQLRLARVRDRALDVVAGVDSEAEGPGVRRAVGKSWRRPAALVDARDGRDVVARVRRSVELLAEVIRTGVHRLLAGRTVDANERRRCDLRAVSLGAYLQSHVPSRALPDLLELDLAARVHVTECEVLEVRCRRGGRPSVGEEVAEAGDFVVATIERREIDPSLDERKLVDEVAGRVRRPRRRERGRLVRDHASDLNGRTRSTFDAGGRTRILEDERTRFPLEDVDDGGVAAVREVARDQEVTFLVRPNEVPARRTTVESDGILEEPEADGVDAARCRLVLTEIEKTCAARADVRGCVSVRDVRLVRGDVGLFPGPLRNVDRVLRETGAVARVGRVGRVVDDARERLRRACARDKRLPVVGG